MLITVVIPSFNQAAYLKDTLNSVISQKYKNKEIIVIDGGSTDGSVDIIKSFEPNLAYWQSCKDGGQTEAISVGFNKARGDLIGWLNSDDVLTDEALTLIADAVRCYGNLNAVFYGGNFVLDAAGEVQDVYPNCRFDRNIAMNIGPTLCQPGTFFGRNIYYRIGGLDNNLQYGMDLDLWYKFVVNRVPFIYIDSILAGFRIHSMQKGHSSYWSAVCENDNNIIKQRYISKNIPKYYKYYLRLLLLYMKIRNGAVFKTLFFRITRHKRIKAYNSLFR